MNNDEEDEGSNNYKGAIIVDVKDHFLVHPRKPTAIEVEGKLQQLQAEPTLLSADRLTTIIANKERRTKLKGGVLTMRNNGILEDPFWITCKDGNAVTCFACTAKTLDDVLGLQENPDESDDYIFLPYRSVEQNAHFTTTSRPTHSAHLEYTVVLTNQRQSRARHAYVHT